MSLSPHLDVAKSASSRIAHEHGHVQTAVVYCEANFGAIDGKTANGLVRHSEKYRILAVIDSEKAGLDAGEVLGEEPNAIPICRNLAAALVHAGCIPDYFIFGMAPASGMLSSHERDLVLDAIPSQFCSGELEATIVEAFENECPDVIIVEGQGALSHPASSTSSFILRGSNPNGVVLQHAPGRRTRCDFDHMLMPTPATEINLIETFSDAKVIGLTINHENMTDDEVDSAITHDELELGIPATDVLSRSPGHLVEMIIAAFPALAEKLPVVTR